MSLFTVEPTDDPILTRVQRNIAAAFKEVDRLIDLAEVTAPVVSQAANYQLVGTELVVIYTGPGGHTFRLASAANRTGRCQVIYILHTGAGNLTVAAAGNQTINGAATATLASGLKMYVSNGSTKWLG